MPQPTPRSTGSVLCNDRGRTGKRQDPAESRRERRAFQREMTIISEQLVQLGWTVEADTPKATRAAGS